MQIEFSISVGNRKVNFKAKILQGKNTVQLFKEMPKLEFCQVLPNVKKSSIAGFELATRYASHQDCKIVKLKNVKTNVEQLLDALADDVLICHRTKGGFFYMCKSHFSKDNTHVNASAYLGEVERFVAEVNAADAAAAAASVPKRATTVVAMPSSSADDVDKQLPPSNQHQEPQPVVAHLVDGVTMTLSPSAEQFEGLFSCATAVDFSRHPILLPSDAIVPTVKVQIASFSCTSLGLEQLHALADAKACLVLPTTSGRSCVVLEVASLNCCSEMTVRVVPASRLRPENAAAVIDAMSATLRSEAFFKGNPESEACARALYEGRPNFFGCCRVYSMGMLDHAMSIMFLDEDAADGPAAAHAYATNLVEQWSTRCVSIDAAPPFNQFLV